MSPVRNIGLAGLVALLAAGAVPAQEASDEAPDNRPEFPAVYRVEIVVFRHADGRSDRKRASAPADFTGHIDPLLVTRANRMPERFATALDRGVPVPLVPGGADETTPFLESGDQTIRPIPPAYAALDDLSPPVQRAMNRLIDAPDYEPLTTRAWIQLAEPNQTTVPMRIHDGTVIDTTPTGETRDALFSGERLVTDNGRVRFRPLLASPDPELAQYRLDGTVRLRRRRFLHLDLDLVWQVPARELSRPAVQRPGPVSGPETEPAAGPEWHLHRLQQSRIVEPGRFEYFDSALFGVLVRIEKFEQVVPEVEEPGPEPGLEPQPAPDSPSATDSAG